MRKKTSEEEKALIQALADYGLPYTAQYVEMFGFDMNPWFGNGRDNRERQEKFYKRCVEEQHPWDYYVDPPPEGAVI